MATQHHPDPYSDTPVNPNEAIPLSRGAEIGVWVNRQIRDPQTRFCLWVALLAVMVAVLVSYIDSAKAGKLAVPSPTAVPASAPQAGGVKDTSTESREANATKDSPKATPKELKDAPVDFISKQIEPVLAWLVAYPLFPLVIVFFWAISWMGLGGSIGLPDLVWPDGWYQRFWVGVAVSLLFVNILFIRYTLALRDALLPGGSDMSFFGQSPTLFPFKSGGDEVRKLGAFLLWTWLPCLAVFYLPKIPTRAYRRFARRVRSAKWTWRVWEMFPLPGLVGLAAGVGVTLLLFWADGQIWPPDGLDDWLVDTWLFKQLPGYGSIPDHQRVLHARAMVMAAIPIIALVILYLMSRLDVVWSPIWSLCLIIALGSSLYGGLAYHLGGVQFFLLGFFLVVVWVCNTGQPHKMSHPGLEHYHLPGNRVDLDRLPDEPQPPVVSRLTAESVLSAFHRKWLVDRERQNWARDELHGTRPKMVIVCVSGGGTRSAVWTTVVLRELERELSGVGGASAFRDHIRLMTGASGGMLGAALYAAAFENPDPPESLDKQLARDSLWRTIQTMLYRDIPAVAVPWALKWDRGRALEKSWHENMRYDPDRGKLAYFLRRARYALKLESPPPSPLQMTFKALRELEEKAERPSLLFSPMLVEDCRRLLISNLDTSGLTSADCETLNAPVPLHPDPRVQSVSGIDFWQCFPQAYEEFQVGTAARMAGTFPFVGPGVSLPTTPARRVVDAGYFDNFGVNLAGRWLLANKQAIIDHTSGVVLIEIRAFSRRIEKVRCRPLEGDRALTWGLAEASTPIEALYNLYARGAYFRNDQLLQSVDAEFNNRPGYQSAQPTEKFFTTVTFECAGAAALNWTLPEWETDDIRRSFRTDPDDPGSPLQPWIGPTMLSLREWFGKGGVRPLVAEPHSNEGSS